MLVDAAAFPGPALFQGIALIVVSVAVIGFVVVDILLDWLRSVFRRRDPKELRQGISEDAWRRIYRGRK